MLNVVVVLVVSSGEIFGFAFPSRTGPEVILCIILKRTALMAIYIGSTTPFGRLVLIPPAGMPPVGFFLPAELVLSPTLA